jgi:hypothetical protein
LSCLTEPVLQNNNGSVFVRNGQPAGCHIHPFRAGPEYVPLVYIYTHLCSSRPFIICFLL